MQKKESTAINIVAQSLGRLAVPLSMPFSFIYFSQMGIRYAFSSAGLNLPASFRSMIDTLFLIPSSLKDYAKSSSLFNPLWPLCYVGILLTALPAAALSVVGGLAYINIGILGGILWGAASSLAWSAYVLAHPKDGWSAMVNNLKNDSDEPGTPSTSAIEKAATFVNGNPLNRSLSNSHIGADTSALPTPPAASNDYTERPGQGPK